MGVKASLLEMDSGAAASKSQQAAVDMHHPLISQTDILYATVF